MLLSAHPGMPQSVGDGHAGLGVWIEQPRYQIAALGRQPRHRHKVPVDDADEHALQLHHLHTGALMAAQGSSLTWLGSVSLRLPVAPRHTSMQRQQAMLCPSRFMLNT